jgi:2-methylisocitrate lyase-like PEP mutase family enzyme
MSMAARKAEQFRGCIFPGRPLVLFNIWDAGSARAGHGSGRRRGDATGSWSVANAFSFADGGISHCLGDRQSAPDRRRNGPTGDDRSGEGGYGDTSEAVDETIRLAIEAGRVENRLEDGFPANGKLRETTRPSRSYPARAADC